MLVKKITIPIIFFAGILGASFPKLLFDRNLRATIGIVNDFTGGVFIAAALVHLLSDSSTLIDLPPDDFPWPFAIFGGSFLMMWCLRTLMPVDDTSKSWDLHGKEPLVNQQQSTTDSPSTDTWVSNNRSGDMHPNVAVICWLALCVHSFLTGLALGIIDNPSEALPLLLAVLAHKSLAVASVSLLLLRSNIKVSNRIILLAVLVCMTPLGVGIGWAAFVNPTDNLEGILSATAGGTFLYIGAIEVLSCRDFDQFIPCRRILKPFAVFSGYALMSILALWS